MINSPLPASFPHMRANSVMQMGMRVVPSSEWLQACIDLEAYYQHKQQVHTEYGNKVFDGLPESQAAQQELSCMLRQHLLQDHDQVYAKMGGHITHLPSGILLDIPGKNRLDSLFETSLWVADDLLLMQELGGEYCLTAASLCSPSSWRLQDKLGKPMARIHDPIPDIHKKLTPKIDQFFSSMASGQVVERYNWSLQEAQELAQFPQPISLPLHADTPLYYRMERQSLRRLPESQAIVFGIRVYVFEMTSLGQVQGALPALKEAIDDLPPGLRDYKNIEFYQPALAKYWG